MPPGAPQESPAHGAAPSHSSSLRLRLDPLYTTPHPDPPVGTVLHPDSPMLSRGSSPSRPSHRTRPAPHHDPPPGQGESLLPAQPPRAPLAAGGHRRCSQREEEPAPASAEHTLALPACPSASAPPCHHSAACVEASVLGWAPVHAGFLPQTPAERTADSLHTYPSSEQLPLILACG